MTLAFRNADIIGAKYDCHVPLLPCEPCTLAKLHHAIVNTNLDTKATAVFYAYSSYVFGTLKEIGPRGAKYMLGVVDYFTNYIWLLALRSKKAVVFTLSPHRRPELALSPSSSSCIPTGHQARL
jgi:hypothetical protein